MNYKKNKTVLKEVELKGLDITVVDTKNDINTETNTFSPIEIKEDFSEEQINKQAKILGINEEILIRFNQDMKKQGKPINFVTFKNWLLMK